MKRAHRLHAALFPVSIWFLACFFRLGDLGRWLDDWLYVQRFGSTGEIRSLILDSSVHFWRPLYRILTPTLATLLWQHDQIHHLLLAAVHALNAWLLWALLRDVGVRRLAAAIAGLGTLSWVGWVGYEVVFWLCALPTSLAVAIALATIRWAMRSTLPHGRPIAFAAALAMIAFASACLNEQPPMLLAGVPVLLVGRRSLRAALLAAAGLALGLAAAAGGHAIFSAAPASMSGQGFLTPIRLWPDAINDTFGWFRDWALHPSIFLRTLDLGWAELSQGSRGAIVGALLLVAIPPWIIAHRRNGHERGPITPLHAHRAPLGLAGLAMAAAALAPIIATSYWLSPRIFYAPLFGVVTAIAAATDALAGDPVRAARRVTARTVIALLAAAGFITSAVAMVGAQRAFAQNARFDREAMEQLAALIPIDLERPVFVPVAVAPRVFDPPPRSPRAAHFDHRFYHVFWSEWSNPSALRLTLRGDDLDIGYPNHRAATPRDAGPWRGPTLSDTPIPGGSVHVNGVGRVAWSRVIPFTVAPSNRVRPIASVEWTSPTGDARRIDLPAVSHLERTTYRFESEQ